MGSTDSATATFLALLLGESPFRRQPGGELHGVDALVEITLHDKPSVTEDADHRVVVGKHMGAERSDALGIGIAGKVLEQQRADASTLLFVHHRKRHLSHGRAGSLWS